MNFLWLIHADSAISFGLDTVSLHSQPLVSKGNGSTQIPKKITISNGTIVAVWWQSCTEPTATRGHNIPPIIPAELAILTPVVRT